MKIYLAIITILLLLCANFVSAQETILSGWITYSTPTSEGLIVVMYNLDTNEERLLTDPALDGRGSVLSPTHDKVAFLSSMDGNTNIYVINSDGTNLIQLTNHPQDEGGITWSVDGNQIAYDQGARGLNYVDLYRVNVDGNSPPVLLTNSTSADWQPAWSPDGNEITFISNRDGSYDVYVMGINGENVIQLTTDGSRASVPQWSPDGSKIGFRGADWHYYYMNPDGTGKTLITNGHGDTGRFYWLSDTRILYEIAKSTLFQSFVAINIDGTVQAEFDYQFPTDFVSISQTTVVNSNNCDVSPTDTSSLISAIDTGNNAGLPYSICLASSVYTLNAVDNSDSIGANALPVITGDISIIGNGATLSRDVSAPDFRFFLVENGANLRLENLTLDNGHTSGTSDAGDGGAIYNDGTVTLDTVILSNNIANIEAGTIYNNDGQTLIITNSSFTGNHALGDDGGAIDNHGLANITSTTFADNHADDDGGAIWNDDTAILVISDSIFTLNTASDKGGVIMNFGTITLTNNIIANNTSGDDGGAISSDSGTITVTNGNFSNNISGDDGGAIMTYAPLSLTGVTLDNNDASDKGGAIYVWDSDLLIDNSTLSNNSSVNKGGAIYIGNASVSSYLLNSCVFGNVAGNTSGVYAENDNFDATANWWGAVDGPGGSDSGNGDEVNSDVNYSNFVATNCADAINTPTQAQSLAVLASNTVPDSSNFPVVDLPYSNNFDDSIDFSSSVRWTRDLTGAGWLLDTDIRGQSSSLEMTTWVELSNNPQVNLSYLERAELASNDVISLEIQLQGSPDWVVLAQNNGTSDDWQETNISLADYRGEVIRLRWHSDIPADAPIGENSLNYAIDELQISRR